MAKSDYISRAAVLNELYRQINATGKYTTYEAALDDVHLFVEKIPAADVVEVKPGRWERVDYGNGLYNYHCSSCRHIPRENIRSNYCPNCGAKMDGEG